MKLEKPIYQKFDLLTKLIGVILVANGINKIRYSEFGWVIFFILLGLIVSIMPLYIKMKES
jgi:hypothetical protein|tara:strand:- start:1499 stop:1681 length:183 start_codon:yes stop_codon:yes gene_type:complete